MDDGIKSGGGGDILCYVPPPVRKVEGSVPLPPPPPRIDAHAYKCIHLKIRPLVVWPSDIFLPPASTRLLVHSGEIRSSRMTCLCSFPSSSGRKKVCLGILDHQI